MPGAHAEISPGSRHGVTGRLLGPAVQLEQARLVRTPYRRRPTVVIACVEGRPRVGSHDAQRGEWSTSDGLTMAITDDDSAVDQLRRIEAVIDSDLDDLDVDELLAALLERIREILSADTAAVLLLDPSASHLVATAASGIEEEVRQGVRIPLGKGFAGRIAAEKTPVILDRVDHTTVLNPALRDKGIRALLGVPLLAGGTAIGVLHVGTLSSRHFTEHDVTLLQLAADRMALATQSRLARAERTAALILQRSLVPARLPQVHGLELAARYVPAGEHGVGGDWYDAFGLPSGWICLVVGDVVGHGLQAATSMGRLRGAVRSYALETVDPAELLSKIDRQVHHFEDGVMATALCAMVEPSHERLLLSSAGHPPPLSVSPDQPATFLDVPADVPLGVDIRLPRHTTTVALPLGTRVCFYTDGLVERRAEPIDAGLERLRRAVLAAPADAICARVMSELLGAEPTTDDVALLVLHRPGCSNTDLTRATASR
jgi:putative methionine-R-sulfoxide reductase with GAF domain